MGPAITLLIFSILSLTAIIIIIICLKGNHCYIQLMFFCTLISFMFALCILSALCRICCVLNTTINESAEEYRIIDMEKIDYEYHIAYIDNDIVKTIKYSDVYDILEISDMVYDMNEKAFLRKNNYIVKVTKECNSPKIIQTIAMLPKNENTIRIYTYDKELLNYYKENTDETIWYIVAATGGIYCILLALGLFFDMKKQKPKHIAPL